MSGGGQQLERAIEPNRSGDPPRRRFAVLLHDHPVVHWDFLLENGETLRTWRLPRDPCQQDVTDAEEIAPHRRFYLDYEGPVSGGRGVVRRVAAGTARVWEMASGAIALDAILLEPAPRGAQENRPWEWIRLTQVDGTQWQFRIGRPVPGENQGIPGAGKE